MPKSWYEIKAQAEGPIDIYVYDEIGLWGITASDFVQELRGLKGQALNVYINSPGGEVFDGIAIYNALKNHGAAVTVTVDSLAASVASVIAQAGDHRVMAKIATMMIHEPYGVAIGDTATMQKMAETLDQMGETIGGIYADRAGGTVEEWRAKMADETWYKAQDAVDAGLADEVATVSKMAAAYAGRVFNLSKFQKVPDWLPQAKAQVRDAGRTMSQSNLDKLHSAIAGLDAVHAGTCDMGADCPMAKAHIDTDWDELDRRIVEHLRALKATAIASHSTATSEGAWDGPGNKARLKNDGDAAYYRKAFAWADPEGDAATKAAYKFIHHEVGGDGAIGAANMTGCSAGIAVLNGGRGGANIPDGDRKGVWNHLAAHLRDGDREPPELKDVFNPGDAIREVVTGRRIRWQR